MATRKMAATSKAASARRVNSFSPSKVQDHTIVDADRKVVGHVRVKPSGILWSPRDGKIWYGVSLDDFARFAVEKGKKQSK
jgi:hypothetical protein